MEAERQPSQPPRPVPQAPGWLRFLDLPLLALALPLFLVADLPIAGYLAAAGAWIAQRALQLVLQARADASDDPRTVAGLTAASMIARGWLCAGAIFAVGLSVGDDAGLSAAVLVIALFTIYFTVRMILRPFDLAAERERRRGAGR